MNFGLGLECFLGLESKTCSIHGACPTRGVKPPCPSHLQVAEGHFVGTPCHRAYKKCVPSLPKDHSWPILVAHATMSICVSNIYDSISQKSSKGWDEGDHSCTIVAYTPKKGAKIHFNCIKNPT
jgi:hypothetical protein